MIVKHKKILKHKYIPPWERKYDVSDLAPKMYSPEMKAYRARLQSGAFYWMVYWCIEGTKFNLNHIVMDYWRQAFVKPFPKEGGRADELCFHILKMLLIKGHERERLEFDESEVKIPWDIHIWDKLKKIHINFDKEYIMAKKAVKTSKKASVGSASVNTDPADGAPVPKMTKKREAEICLYGLLMEEKYTDQEMVDMIQEQCEYTFVPRRVAKRRKRLNDGLAESFGFPQPDHEIEQIGGDVTTSRAPSKSAAKSPPTKPVKKAAKKSVKSGLGGLVGGKKKKFSFKKKS